MQRDDYRVVPETDRFGAALSAADLVLARSGSTSGRSRRPAPGRARAVSVRDRRPQAANASISSSGRRDHGARARPRRRARARALAARRSGAARADGCGDARGGAAGRCRARSPTSWSRWPADEGSEAVVRRDRRRRPERVRPARARARARRSAAGTGCTRRTSTRSATCEVEIAPEPVVPDGWEVVVSSAYPQVPGCGGRSSCASSSPAARRSSSRDPRQGHDGRDDRLRPARDRPRPGVADRCARATARLECRLRRRHPRRRGRRVGPHGLRAAARRSPSSRTSSSTITPSTVARRPGAAPSRVARDGGHRRPRCAAVRRRAGAARRVEPAQRRLGARGARGCRSRPRRGRARARALHRHRPALRGARAGDRTLVDDYGHHPTEVARTLAAVRERSPGGRSAFSSSRISTRGRAISPASSPQRSPPPTT